MFRRTAIAATIAAAALILSACAGDAQPTETPSPTGAPDADATLRVGLVLEPTNLDIRTTSGAALEQILLDNVYESLLTRTQENEIEPRLATAYEVSDDGLTYTFTIAEGVTFHNGQALTAADVVASLTAVKDDEGVVGHAELADVATIAAAEDGTVVLTLTQPNINLLFSLTGPAGIIVPATDDTDRKTAANGTGPYTLSSWKQGDSITFVRNDAYWGTPATLAEVVFTYIPDFTAGVSAAVAGSVDVLTAVDPQLAPQLDGQSGFHLTVGKTTDKATLAFNNAKAPLDDERVREALRLAIDHDALVAAVGAGVTQYGPIPELDPGYEDLSADVPFDQAKARELLAEAGVEDLELTLTIPSFYGTTVPQLLISDFNEVGVTLAVNSVEFGAWLQDVYTNKDYDLSYILHVEPRDFGNWANPEYYFNYDNAEVQELYAQALSTTDADESAELLAEAARLVSEDHAADWLYTGETITAVGDHVTGFPVNSINSRINLAGVELHD